MNFRKIHPFLWVHGSLNKLYTLYSTLIHTCSNQEIWNCKNFSWPTLPTHRILQEDRSAFNCARFIEIRLVIYESLKVVTRLYYGFLVSLNVIMIVINALWVKECKMESYFKPSFDWKYAILFKILHSYPACKRGQSPNIVVWKKNFELMQPEVGILFYFP